MDYDRGWRMPFADWNTLVDMYPGKGEKGKAADGAADARKILKGVWAYEKEVLYVGFTVVLSLDRVLGH